MTYLADPRLVAAEVRAAAIAPPLPVDLNAWAPDHIKFGKESPLPGPYDAARFPFFRRILEVLSLDHPAAEVVIRKSAQLGGTVLAQIFVGGTLDLAPRPVLYVHPTDGNGKKWKRNKFAQMVQASPSLIAMMQPDGARSGNSAMYWARRDGRGWLQIAGANSPSQLSMDSYPVAVHDDLAKWLADNGAGDPEVQADSRGKAFRASGGKTLKISTPRILPGCRITRAWARGTRERWHVPCPACGVHQALEWANMLACLDDTRPDDAHFTCVHCGARIDEVDREWMNARGDWVAENPTAEVLSFYLWGAYSPLERWANIARAWLDAKGNPESEETFLNDFIGEAYQTAMAAPDWQVLRERAELMALIRGQVPAGMLIVTIGVDCQVDRCEWQAVAWGPRLQRIVIDAGVIHAPINEKDAHTELTALLDRTWPDAFGGRRRLDMLAIDGNYLTDHVQGWARRVKSSRVIVVRGAKSDVAPPLALVKTERRPDGKIIRAQRRWYNVGVAGMKASLYANLRKSDPLDLGFIGFAAGLDDEFYRQLTSEIRKPIKKRDGSTEWRWIPVEGIAQEMLDTHLYAQAAAIRCGWSAKSDEQWEALRRELEVVRGEAVELPLFAAPAPAPAVAAPVPAPHMIPSGPIRSGNEWLGSDG